MSIEGGWRELQFFDFVPVRDPQSAGPLYSDPALITLCNSKSSVIYSTQNGYIKEFDENTLLIREFLADPDTSRSIERLEFLSEWSILVTISTKDGHPSVITLWDWKTKAGSTPKIISTVSVSNGDDLHPMTAAYVAGDASVMVFGYGDGNVVAVRGDILHDKGSRQRKVYTATSAITSLYGVPGSDDKLVFATTLDQVLTINTTGTILGGSVVKSLDKTSGVTHGCSVLVDGQLLVARGNQLCTFTDHAKGPSILLPLVVRSLFKYKQYLVVLSTVDQSGFLASEEKFRLLIIDRALRFVSYRGVVGSLVRSALDVWGRLNIFDTKGLLYVFREKNVESKLDIVVKHQLFPLAITIAESEGCDEQTVMILRQKYADFLDETGDSKGALENYIACVGLGNTSHVVLRLRDGRKATELLAYLENLLDTGHATVRHLTLLTICYINLGDGAKLSKFLERIVDNEAIEFAQLIDLCRNAEMFEQAAYLAEKWPDPDLVVQIRLLDMDAWAKALAYIRTLSTSDALRVLIQYSRKLLNLAPVETSTLLISLFTGKFNDSYKSQTYPKKPKTEVSTSSYIPVISSFEAFKAFLSTSNGDQGAADLAALQSTTGELTYQPPRPRLIFPSFNGHEMEFVVFLEACLEAAPFFQPPDQDLSDLVSTLYETYAKLSLKHPDDTSWLDKMTKLTHDYGKSFDLGVASLINEAYQLDIAGSLLVGLGAGPSILFRSLIVDNHISEAVALLDGSYDNERTKTLYETALGMMATNESLYIALKPHLQRLFREIFENSWLSAAEIIHTAGKCPWLTVGDIRGFILSVCEKNKLAEARSLKLAESYEQELEQVTTALHKLQNEPQVLKLGACALCLAPLDLPIVHFACGHTFHERCLDGSEECVIHMADNLLEPVAKEESTGAMEALTDALNHTKGSRMAVIQEAISRGGLNFQNS